MSLNLNLFSDPQLFGMLENSSKMYEKLGLKLSSKTVNTIIQSLKKQIPKIDPKKINVLHGDLQDTVDVEFSKKSSYHKKIFCLHQSDYRISLRKYPKLVRQILNANAKVDRLERRVNSYRNLEILRSAVMKNNPNMEEKFVGLNYAYLGMVDGLYKSSLQECYTWHKIAKNEKINVDNIINSDVAEIYNHFQQEKMDLSFFNGWDKTVRNSVGHSSFKYSETKQKMTYEDYDKKTKEYNTIDYTFSELAENYYKLEAVYHVVLAITHVSMVNDCSWAICTRYQ